ncbi:type IV pilus twitching motility protein PilT [Bacillota bacterium LX-D]|nr:type IV pilus twitching motility protein PilT [Bacillota bacterium LX-D]
MLLKDILQSALNKKASDIHLTVGQRPVFRVNGSLEPQLDFENISPEKNELFTKEMLDSSKLSLLQQNGELDFAYSIAGLGRFRVNAFYQRGSISLVLRIINSSILSFEELNLPTILNEFTKKNSGIVLVTGPTGSGKSTTLAALIDKINNEHNCHIITLEDPIEYTHKHKKSIVNQREIGSDSRCFAAALRAALRQDPDVIMVGEMRDLETISTALTAAETGHLVFATLHTSSASQTIDRIIDVFPNHQQQQVRIQLADSLQGIVSQQLIPLKNLKGRVAAFEVLVASTAIRNLIREGKTYQIISSIQTGAKYGMVSMDMALNNLLQKGLISQEEFLARNTDKNSYFNK